MDFSISMEIGVASYTGNSQDEKKIVAYLTVGVEYSKSRIKISSGFLHWCIG